MYDGLDWIITEFLDFVHCPVFNKTIEHCYLETGMYPSYVKQKAPILSGPLETANLSQFPKIQYFRAFWTIVRTL